MKCKKCRKTIPDGSKFCNHCGAPLGGKKKLYRRPDGLYEKIMIIDGKRVAFRAQKETDVWKKIREYQTRQEQGLLFEEVADMWEEEHRKTLAPTSWRQSYAFPFGEIKEYFSGRYIREITHKDVNAYMRQLPKTYARKTCATRLNIINMIFKFAVVEELVEDNPCSYITVPKGHGAKKRSAPTTAEIVTIKKSIGVTFKSFPVGVLAAFLLYTGCRKGEALALTQNDVDRKSKRLSVTKSVYYVSNEPHLKEPKTAAGRREVVLPDYVLDLLPKGKKSDLLFCRERGQLMKKDFFDKAWHYWQRETGLTLTAHQLRHGYATLLHEADIDVKDAQALLGHADAGTTQNIYTEVSDRRREIVAERINNYLQ
ncbi:MAG: tyrosine-type recombinase/integrase [Ruminococcus sp.]|nr:tyrosine-type recombinase/integrase [Ruminococcus sp.]